MKKLEIAQVELDKENLWDGKLNSTALKMVEILGKNVPFNMAMGIANFIMATFVGHFHYKIKMKDDNHFPMNVILFILAKSGARKTSSVLKLEKALKKGYEVIESHRIHQEQVRSSALDIEPQRLNPLSNALATEAGMIKRLNDFKREGIGLPAMFVDEISTELATNPDIIPNIKLVAQLFDIGEMKSKPLKDSENQSDEVVGMGMNALFIGSEYGILENEETLKMFIEEMISKFSRRASFIYPFFEKEDDDYAGIDELLAEMDEEDASSEEIREEVSLLSMEIAQECIDNDINLIVMDKATIKLYQIYQIWCEEEAYKIESEAVNLELQHRHWKALKLAGVYAVFNRHLSITVEDLKEAINTVHLTGGDLEKFLNKAGRQTYEIMVEYFLREGGSLTVHEMIKMGWIKRKSNLKDLLIAANSLLGKTGRIEELLDTIVFDTYEELDTDKSIYASYKKLPPLNIGKYENQGFDYLEAKKKAKDERAGKIADGYLYKETTFIKLANLLKADTAYTPFKFKTKDEGGVFNEKVIPNPVGGIRRKENIGSGAQFIVLDVDDAGISIHEASDMLADYKYHMAITSDPDNIYKFRVILPLDINVTLDRTDWKQFMLKVSEHLRIKIDLLPQSQIYFGFGNREVISNLEGEDLEASEIIKQLTEPKTVILPVSRKLLDAIWVDRMNTFGYAYNVKSGGGVHNSLYNAMKHAYDLGYSYDENVMLLGDIINFMEDKPRDSFYDSLNSQRDETYGKKKGDLDDESYEDS